MCGRGPRGRRILCASIYGEVSEGLSNTHWEFQDRVAAHCQESNMQYFIRGGYNIPHEAPASPGFSEAQGAQVSVSEPPLSSQGKSK
eukprot:8529168-Pyramimonas_sp.AAC.1